MGLKEIKAGIIKGVKYVAGVKSARWLENKTRKNSYYCSNCTCCTTQKLNKCPKCNSVMEEA